jgi:hypothetical protein
MVLVPHINGNRNLIFRYDFSPINKNNFKNLVLILEIKSSCSYPKLLNYLILLPKIRTNNSNPPNKGTSIVPKKGHSAKMGIMA